MKKIKCALLIDDDGTANYVNQKVLERLAVAEKIEMAMNGEKALNLIQFYAQNNEGKSPELILLDLKMPVLDGYDFLEYYFRKNLTNKSDVKIIVLSAHADEKSKLFQKKYPEIQIVIKPLSESKLYEVLKQ